MVKSNTLILGGAILLGAGFLLFTDAGKRILNIGGLFAGDIMTKITGGDPRSVGAYAVDLRQLPYDPNNYYLPPRDSSILP